MQEQVGIMEEAACRDFLPRTPMNPKSLPAIFLFLTAAFPGQAALIFTLDPLAKTFYFSGSDSGTPNSSILDGTSEWTTQIPLESVANQNIDLGAAVSAESGFSFFNNSFLQLLGSVDRIEIEIRPKTAVFQTITGTEVPVSYAGLNASHQTSLETFVANGGIFDLALGAGFSPITTVAVPEPSAILLGVVGIALLLAAWGGKKRDLRAAPAVTKPAPHDREHCRPFRSAPRRRG